MEFRSANAPPGYFREPGRVHAHIDAGGSSLIDRVYEIVSRLDNECLYSKCNKIISSFSGPHRDHPDFRLTYANHTPGTNPAHQFDVFSTTALDTTRAATTIKYILEQFADIEGVVVEVERVLAVMEDTELRGPVGLIPSMNDADVGFESLYTHPVEIHLAFDLDKTRFSRNGESLLSPQDVFQRTDPKGLKVGEWFLFDKGTHWAFRSSQFLEIDGFQEIARDYHALMKECLKEMFDDKVNSWTIVEQILGLWKTRISKRIEYRGSTKRKFRGELTLPQLGRWEQSFPKLSHFWGITPNFLGDTNPDIHAAMLFNLTQRGTIYTYFLHSFADLQRLREFTARLQEELGMIDLSKQIKPVLLWERPGRGPNGPMRNEYFLANPTTKKPEAYRILRNYSGSVVIGRRVPSTEVERIVAVLAPLLDRPLEGICPPSVPYREQSGLAIAYTDLEQSVQIMRKTPPEIWEMMLEAYDQLVARETSRVGGEVVKALGDGYLLAFPTTGAAIDFAIRIQKVLDHYNYDKGIRNPEACVPNHKIALDHGPLRRVERSHGYDLSGLALSRCARVVDRLNGKHVVMTKQFKDQFDGELTRPGRSGDTVKFIGSLPLKGFGEDTVDIFELIWRDRNGIPITPLSLDALFDKGT